LVDLWGLQPWCYSFENIKTGNKDDCLVLFPLKLSPLPSRRPNACINSGQSMGDSVSWMLSNAFKSICIVRGDSGTQESLKVWQHSHYWETGMSSCPLLKHYIFISLLSACSGSYTMGL
jgi:hypothetical protein